MQTNWGRAAGWAIAAPMAMAMLSGCGVIPGSSGVIRIEGTAGPAPVATASVEAPGKAIPAGADSTAAGSAPSGDGTGCPAGGAKIPATADQAKTQDLDGDGKADTLWIAIDGKDRVLGVETASGARFSTVFTNSPQSTANAVAGRLGDGSAVILLDFSREARLYAVIGCKIVKTLNAQGEQYAFDEGITGYGSGVGCPAIASGGGRELVGYLAKINGQGDGYTVTRTIIKLSKNGTRAVNGAAEILAKGAAGDSSVVSSAQSVICGPGERAIEQAS